MNTNLIRSSLKRKVYEILGKTSLTRNQLNKWLKLIDLKADRVLEVGANFNPVMKKLKSWNVNIYKTLDNNLQGNCKPDFNIDLNHLEKHEIQMQKVKKFSPEVIFCLEVMEYIYKPYEVLSFFHKILAKNGVIYITFHTIYAVHEPYKYDSLRYTKWGIINLLKDAGFSKWEITSRPTTMGKTDILSFYKKERMWALKNSDLITDTGYLVKAYK